MPRRDISHIGIISTPTVNLQRAPQKRVRFGRIDRPTNRTNARTREGVVLESMPRSAPASRGITRFPQGRIPRGGTYVRAPSPHRMAFSPHRTASFHVNISEQGDKPRCMEEDTFLDARYAAVQAWATKRRHEGIWVSSPERKHISHAMMAAMAGSRQFLNFEVRDRAAQDT